LLHPDFESAAPIGSQQLEHRVSPFDLLSAKA
jgi:hypothetical protein